MNKSTKRFLKRTAAVFTAALMCVSLSSCGTNMKKADMTRFHKYLSRSEEDVRNYLNLSQKDIKSQIRTPSGLGVDITLKEPFKYEGEEAEVILMFYLDRLTAVKYWFKETDEGYSKAAYDYAIAIMNKFDKIYDKPNLGYTTSPNSHLSNTSEEDYKKSLSLIDDPLITISWGESWKMEDKYGYIDGLPDDVVEQFGDDLMVSLNLAKSKKDSLISIGLWNANEVQNS